MSNFDNIVNARLARATQVTKTVVRVDPVYFGQRVQQPLPVLTQVVQRAQSN